MTVISVDYDGIIVTDGNWPEPGQVIPEAVESINRLHDSGFCIIINSCRIGKAEEAMVRKLNELGINYCRVNENCPERIKKYETDTRKISADLYIDDRSVFNPLKHMSWPDLTDHIIRRFEGPQKRQCNHSGAHEFLAYNAFLQMLKESE
ncbi:hypothetical protein ACKUB1_13760 [Methanospirillum stamsii]|uniref:Hydrolase n=1 Tax=Methanospirillum stamsii TaxID=1277351 RepID=A0A2V2NEI0_9EURY|nr:hypothetical protein [Methanospirillum stamsii]PWR74828.1 hypothetical protein DLD82_07990 [Methanospirillum stamsii]